MPESATNRRTPPEPSPPPHLQTPLPAMRWLQRAHAGNIGERAGLASNSAKSTASPALWATPTKSQPTSAYLRLETDVWEADACSPSSGDGTIAACASPGQPGISACRRATATTAPPRGQHNSTSSVSPLLFSYLLFLLTNQPLLYYHTSD